MRSRCGVCVESFILDRQRGYFTKKVAFIKGTLVQVGVDLSSLHFAKNATYTSDLFLTPMLQALASVIHDETTDMLQWSTFVGLSADETTDVLNITQLDLHLRFILEGRIVSRFGAIQSVPNTTAETLSNAISQWCIQRGINMRRLHFGTDGAANFTGRYTGVATQLRAVNPHMVHVHCVAHREALAAGDVCQTIAYLKDVFQPTLGGVFRSFDNSPTRESSLHQIQAWLQIKETKLKEPKFVRWLSRAAAVSAFVKCLPAVITALEREATERKDPAAKAYANRVKTFRFVACLLLLADVLPHLSHLSRKFQESNLDYSQLKPALDTTVLCIQQMFTHFGTQERKL